MKAYGPHSFGDRFADIYDTWYGTRIADKTIRESVQVLFELAAGGTVLELAIGTGRIALPLAQRGVQVRGIDASEAMVAKLHEKPGGASLPVTIGDFADVGVDGEFDLIFVVFNTLFNLTAQEDQLRCFRNVARHLTARGAFVVEAFVPDITALSGSNVRAVDVTFDSVTLEASLHDPVAQLVQYQYVVIRPDKTQLYLVPQRYAWPSELDLMARLAGLELRARWEGWSRAPFTAKSPQHVSVYARSPQST